MWQEIIVGLCVLAAVIFLLRRWLPVGQRKSAGCGSSCGGCDSASKSCSTEELKSTSSH